MNPRLQHFVWRYPEWWIAVLCALCGVWVLSLGWQHAGHQMTAEQELGHWMLMVMAMMTPFTLDMIRVAAVKSLWRRRNRAMLIFLAGYLTPWLAVGLVAARLRQDSWAHSDAAPAALFCFAAVWIATPFRARALAECHRKYPLAPAGWRADRDCLRFGGAIGAACVAGCWPLMLACAFAGHSWIAMAGGMVVGMLERWTYRPQRRAAVETTAALASYYLILALLPQGPALAEPASKPAIVAASVAPFSLHAAETALTLSPSKGGALAHVQHRPGSRYYLGVEDITSELPAPPYSVRLNGLFAGRMPMYGLQEATRGKPGAAKTGLTYRFDVTEAMKRLASLPDWDPARLQVAFTPGKWSGKTAVRVGRVVLVEESAGGR